MPDTLRPARIEWAQGLPLSADFGDVYFSRDGGLAETTHVFLQQNCLPQRFPKLTPGAGFTIAETGFGTGLNWLASMDLWRQSRSPGWLHFASVEKFPLTPADLEKAQACWPALAEYARRLQRSYPLPLAGFHRLCFPEWRSTLTLFFGDIAEFLPHFSGAVDAWFLDGFAPDRNPDMWSETLYRAMAMHSRPGATFATFTAAGHVRRGLAAAGFNVEKAPGFGSKREMLRGQIDAAAAVRAGSIRKEKPWLQRPAVSSAEKKACVIGAGIAGAQTAHRLALRGWEVTVLEKHQPASGASGNPAAVLYPRLAPAAEAQDHFPQQAWLFALQELSSCQGPDSPWHPCGLLQLLTGNEGDEFPPEKYASAAHLTELLDAEAASAQSGVTVHHAALRFPQAGWLEPAKYCRSLLRTPGIAVLTDAQAQRLERIGKDWQVLGDDGTVFCSAPVVIIANAGEAVRFRQLEMLPLQSVRGQVSLVRASTQSAALTTVICHDGYLTPQLPDGRHCLGATFQPGDCDISVRATDHADNLSLLSSVLPELAASLPALTEWEGRAALRCQSPDYLPLVGPVADYGHFCAAYAGMRDGKVMDYPDLPALPGLYVNLAHGAKGFSQAGLAAEILAAELNGEPAPVSRRALEALHPMRFWIRQLKRRQ
jgi:tRNA 5-methylaminomethyl-2-thiouridine biosynthesis bifunctional protein